MLIYTLRYINRNMELKNLIEWFGQESEENKDKPNILLQIKAVDTKPR